MIASNAAHDTTERLSYFLFAPVSTKRPAGDRGQAEMKEVCLKCHTRPRIDDFYAKAEAVLTSTNEKVKSATDLVASMRAEGLLTPAPMLLEMLTGLVGAGLHVEANLRHSAITAMADRFVFGAPAFAPLLFANLALLSLLGLWSCRTAEQSNAPAA